MVLPFWSDRINSSTWLKARTLAVARAERRVKADEPEGMAPRLSLRQGPVGWQS
jgi:hypothetical protein